MAGKPHRDKQLGLWLLPLPTIDPFVVARSGAALASYGPDFRYSHYAGAQDAALHRRWRVAAGRRWPSSAQIPPLRNFLKSAGPAGRGAVGEAPARSHWFTVDFVGESGGRTVRTRVSGGDPGYTETAKMLAESALCLALDDNPQTAGQVTTAHAMAENLLARLQKAGIRFEVRLSDATAQAKSVSPTQPSARGHAGGYGEQAGAGVLEVLHQPVVARRAGSASGCTACRGRARRR